jgi:hypothetical protein
MKLYTTYIKNIYLWVNQKLKDMKKSKLINLDENVIEVLQKQADAAGRSLKSHMEIILTANTAWVAGDITEIPDNLHLVRSPRAYDQWGQRTAIEGDVKSLEKCNLKYIRAVRNSSDLPPIHSVINYVHKEKNVIEINGEIYMNHPNAISNYVEEYAEKAEAIIFGNIKKMEVAIFTHEIKQKIDEMTMEDVIELYEYLKKKVE